MRPPLRLLAALGLAVGLALSACGSPGRPVLGAQFPAATTTTAVPVRMVAEVRDALTSIDVFDVPGAPTASSGVPTSQ